MVEGPNSVWFRVIGSELPCSLQIEFGANQAIIVRSTTEDGLQVLPEKVRFSNALILEALQSKVGGRHRRCTLTNQNFQN